MQARPRLRPFSLGELLDESFRLYRREFVVLLAIAALVLVPYAVIEYLLQLPFQDRILRIQDAQLQQFQNPQPGADPFAGMTPMDFFGEILFASLLPLAFGMLYQIVFQPILQGALARAVSQRYLERAVSVGDSFGTALRRAPALIVAQLVPFSIGLLTFGAMAGLFFGAVSTDTTFLPLLLLGFFVSGLLVFVLTIFLTVRFLFSSQAVVLEERGPIQAIKRSWRLTQDYFWRTLGYVIVIGLLLAIVGAITGGVIQGVVQLFLATNLQLVLLISTVISAVVEVCVTPFGMIAYTLMYYDLRIRKEGFDLQQQTTDLYQGSDSPYRQSIGM